MQDEKYGKRRQVSFRIGPLCEDRLNRAAVLFNLKPCEYVKALLYKDLGVYDEPPNRRRRTWLGKEKHLELEDAADECLHLKEEFERRAQRKLGR